MNLIVFSQRVPLPSQPVPVVMPVGAHTEPSAANLAVY
jgi:hypothetical protein